MNPDTVSLIQRPYQEIVDDVLTAIVGGVVREPIIYDLKETHFPLSQKASNVRSITGTHTPPGTEAPVHTSFQKGVDFAFTAADNSIVWQMGGMAPDDETTFYVDYFLTTSRSPISDINVGSVTRTLAEAFSREAATVYQQINQAYLSAFVDTAKGQSLDLVVSILGVSRKTKNYATGLVTFFRDPAVEGNITIPAEILLSTTDGSKTFVTSEFRTLQRGQVRVDVPIRATDASAGQVGVVLAGAITSLAQPIAGIARISNIDPTVLGSDDETDDQLRLRAKAALQGLGKATLAALEQVIFAERAKLDEVWDPNSPPDKRSAPGSVLLLVKAEPARFPSLQGGIDETRAAGVQVTLVARYVFFKPRVVARIAANEIPADDAGKLKLIGQIVGAMQSYIDGLSAGQPAKGPDLQQNMLKNVKELGNDPKNIRFVDVMTWRADIGRPGPDATVDALLRAIADTPAGNAAALRTALTNVLTNAPITLPDSNRIPDRSLIQGLTAAPPTDAEIEAGEFQISASVGGDQWWIVLDVEPADITLAER